MFTYYIIDKMRLIMFTILSLLVFAYLFFFYIRFYNFIGDIDLQSPFLENSLLLDNPKGTGSVKYVALGDSLTAGVGSQNIKNTFVYQFALELSGKFEKVVLVNFAQPGGTTEDVIRDQLSRALEEKPAYVTLLIGTNDIHNKRTVKDFREKYRYILDELLTKTDAHITVMNIPYLGSGKLVYPPFNFLLDLRTKQFNKVISSLVAGTANKDRVRFIDLYKDTYALPKQSQSYYSSDLFHPSGEGYLLWAKIINAN